MNRHIPNLITVARIIFSLGLLFLPVLSLQFTGVYLICGLSDMADGLIARKTGTATAFGAKLDSVADLVFVIAASVKLLSALDIPAWSLWWAGGILLIRTLDLLLRKRFCISHSLMNKLTGFLLFLLPISVSPGPIEFGAFLCCSMASAAAVEEWFSVRIKG